VAERQDELNRERKQRQPAAECPVRSKPAHQESLN
jgi:hypothetical protein